jgi:tetratricopeptide (TPR) repeat protein
MRDITEDEIRSRFSEKTFYRGQAYFEDGHVATRAKKGDTLIGYVQGTLDYPYKVEATITDTIFCTCSCPVGINCKHGVALLLQWVNNRDLFVDCDRFLASLRKKSKEELIKIIQAVIEDDPVLASRLAFSEEVAHGKAPLETIIKRLSQMGRRFIDYYEVSGVAEELEDMKEVGNIFAEEGQFEDAVEVYLLLIEGGIDIFENGVDDSDGELGEAIIGCVEDFVRAATNLGEDQKRGLIYRILNIMEVEDYGLEADEMLFGAATKDNMSIIEEELLKRVPAKGEKFHAGYKRRRALELLTELYGQVGMHDHALRVVQGIGLVDGYDYMLMAKVLMKMGNHEKAFEYIREGLSKGSGEPFTRLGEYYFDLLQSLLKEKKVVDVDVKEALAAGVYALSSFFHFNPEKYETIKDVFNKIGEYERFISTVKKRCKEETVIRVLLYEDYIDDAIKYALSSALYSSLLLDVADAAREKGNTEAAVRLTLKALEQQGVSADAQGKELIKLVVAESDEKELRRALGCIRDAGVARVFADALLERNQEYTFNVLKQFMRDLKKEEIEKYAVALEGEYARDLCRSWVSFAINRSHVYYDGAIDVLKVMRKMITEKEWKKYITEFMEENKGKKKLMEKMKALLFEL